MVLVKYSPDQARDDHGRWTGDGGSPTVESLAAQNVHVTNFEEIDPPLRQTVLDAAQSFRDRFPKIPLLVEVRQRVDGAIASAAGYGVSLSPTWYGPGGAARWDAYVPKDVRAGWSAQPGALGAIEHEFGHVIDWMDRFDASATLFTGWGRAETGSGSRGNQERFAEAFSQLALRPESEYTTDAQRVNEWLKTSSMGQYVTRKVYKAQALLHAPTDELLGLRAFLLKYSPDQPRDDHGRWSGDGQAWGAPYSADQQMAIRGWVALGWDSEINSLLRTDFKDFVGVTQGLRDRTEAKVADLTSAVRPMPEREVLYRGVDADAFGLEAGDDPATVADLLREMVGQTVRDPGFTSTTTDSSLRLYDWADIRMRISAPAGTPAINVGSVVNEGTKIDENEVLFPPGTGLRLDGVTYDHRGTQVDVRATVVP